MGRILSQLGKFQASKLFFERVLVLHPASERVLFVLGNVMHVLGEHLVALPLLEAVAEGYHRDVDMTLEECPYKSSKATYLASVALCGLLYQNVHHDLQRAEGCYDIVLKEEPTHIKANDFKCALRVMQGREAEASEMHHKMCMIHTQHLSKPCAYLDALFPQTSSMLHPISNLKVMYAPCPLPPPRPGWSLVLDSDASGPLFAGENWQFQQHFWRRGLFHTKQHGAQGRNLGQALAR